MRTALLSPVRFNKPFSILATSVSEIGDWQHPCILEGRGSSLCQVDALETLRAFPFIGEAVAALPPKQAYQILHFAFIAAPIIAGLDKFLHLLTNWDIYLAPWIANLSPNRGHNLMIVVFKRTRRRMDCVRLFVGNYYQSAIISRLLRHRTKGFWTIPGRACAGQSERRNSPDRAHAKP